MKKLMKWMMSIATVAISLTGCQQPAETVVPADKAFALILVTDNIASRTEYDPALMDIKWSGDDMATVYIKGTKDVVAPRINESDPRFASFIWMPINGMQQTLQGRRMIQGFAPSRALIQGHFDSPYDADRNYAESFDLRLPDYQDGSSKSFDKAADLLVADNMWVDITAEDIAWRGKTVDGFRFRRVVAISEFTFKVTHPLLEGRNEFVKEVSFEVVGEKYLAGSMRIKPTEEGAQYVTSTGANDYFFDNRSSKVTVRLSDEPSLGNGFTAWVVTSPITLEKNDRLIFTVTTTKGTVITKSIDSVGREVGFSTTKKNTLTVSLDSSAEVKEDNSLWISPGSYAFVVQSRRGTKVGYYAMCSSYNVHPYRQGSVDVSEWVGDLVRDGLVINDQLIYSRIQYAISPAYDFSGEIRGSFIGRRPDCLVGSDDRNEQAWAWGWTNPSYPCVYEGVIRPNGSTRVFLKDAINTPNPRCLAFDYDTGDFACFLKDDDGVNNEIFIVPCTFEDRITLRVDEQPDTVPASGATFDVKITIRNTNFGASWSEMWIKKADIHQLETGQMVMTVVVAPNESASPRSDTITIEGWYGTSATVYINQLGA